MTPTTKKPPAGHAAAYVLLYPALVEVAKAHGYALAIHGSLARDFDLVAIPWTEEAGEPYPMIVAMKEACGAVFTGQEWDHLLREGNVNDKPHGRRAWSLHLTEKGMYGPYLDVSVMPRAPASN